jgi:hypothetical protein
MRRASSRVSSFAEARRPARFLLEIDMRRTMKQAT